MSGSNPCAENSFVTFVTTEEFFRRCLSRHNEKNVGGESTCVDVSLTVQKKASRTTATTPRPPRPRLFGAATLSPLHDSRQLQELACPRSGPHVVENAEAQCSFVRHHPHDRHARGSAVCPFTLCVWHSSRFFVGPAVRGDVFHFQWTA